MKSVKRIEDITQTRGEVYIESTGRIGKVVDLRSFIEMGIDDVWIAYPLVNGCHVLMEVGEVV